MFTSICFCVNKYYIFPYIPASTDSSQVLNQHTNNSSTFSDDYDNKQVLEKQQEESPVMSPELDSESLKQSKLNRERKAFENASTGTCVCTYKYVHGY